jgi:hypothetical protein
MRAAVCVAGFSACASLVAMIYCASSLLGASCRPLVDKTGLETTTVHVFGSQWDLAPEGYDTVRFPLL